MIQLTAQQMPGLFDVLRTAGPTPTMTSNFALALSGVMGLASAPVASAAGGLVAVADRQADAGSGNTLPVDVAGIGLAAATPPFPAALQAPAALPVSAEEMPLLPGLPTVDARPEIRSTPAPTRARLAAVEKPGLSPLQSPAPVRTNMAKSIDNDPSGHTEAPTRLRGKARKDRGEDIPLVPDALLPSKVWPDAMAAGSAPQAAVPTSMSFDPVPVDDLLPAARLTPVIDPGVAVAAIPGQAPAAPVSDAAPVPTAARGPAGAPEIQAAANLQPTAPTPAPQRTVPREAQPVSEAVPLASLAEASPAPTRHKDTPTCNVLSSVVALPVDSGLPADTAPIPREGVPQVTTSSAPVSATRADDTRPAPTPQVATPRPNARAAASRVGEGTGTRADGLPRFEGERPDPTPAPASHATFTIDTVAARLAPASLLPSGTAASAPVAQAAAAVTQPPAPLNQQAPAAPEVETVVRPLAPAPHAQPDDLQTGPAAAPVAQSPAHRTSVGNQADPARPVPAREAPALAPQPAAQAFAAAMFAASERPAPRRGDAVAELAAAFPLAGLGGATPASPVTVEPIAAPQALPLDTNTDEWIGAMIERIETLRDEGAGVRETRIRLTPDALGTLDVAIRQDGDAVTVRIAAETPAARALLAEAAPRLTDLAEARGLKLAGTGIEGGGTGGSPAFADRQPSRQPDAPMPARPRAAANDADDADVADTRIA